MKKKLNNKEKKEIFSYVYERFGIQENVFKEMGFFKTQKAIYVATRTCISSPLFNYTETAGLAFLRFNKVLKPTTNFLQLFGKHIKKNFIALDKDDAERFIRGEDLEVGEKRDLNPGYVMVKYKEHTLGCANFKEGNLKNMISKSRRRRIKIG